MAFGGFNKQGGGAPMAEINMIPLIDVMLVLLVIFMVTAPLVVPAQIELPSVAKTSSAPALPIEIVIGADANLRLIERGAAQTDKPVDRAEAVRYVKARQADKPDTPVVISADKSVRYEVVLAVMDELQKADVKRVGLSVKPAAK